MRWPRPWRGDVSRGSTCLVRTEEKFSSCQAGGHHGDGAQTIHPQLLQGSATGQSCESTAATRWQHRRVLTGTGMLRAMSSQVVHNAVVSFRANRRGGLQDVKKLSKGVQGRGKPYSRPIHSLAPTSAALSSLSVAALGWPTSVSSTSGSCSLFRSFHYRKEPGASTP